MQLWLEKTPPFFPMQEEGYLRVTSTLKVAGAPRPVKQTMSFQLVLKGPRPPVLTAAPPANVELAYVSPSALRTMTPNPTSNFIPGYAELVAGAVGNNVVLISNETLSTFLYSNLIQNCCAVQSRSTLYRKVKLEFMLSKAFNGSLNTGNLDALVVYRSVNLTVCEKIYGNIDGNNRPAIGAIGINLYPGEPTEIAADTELSQQQDKPGRFLIRGAAISTEEALRGTPILSLCNLLTDGAPVTQGSPWCFRPITDVMQNLWTIRAAQSAGYVRVASQSAKNPRLSIEFEGGL